MAQLHLVDGSAYSRKTKFSKETRAIVTDLLRYNYKHRSAKESFLFSRVVQYDLERHESLSHARGRTFPSEFPSPFWPHCGAKTCRQEIWKRDFVLCRLTVLFWMTGVWVCCPIEGNSIRVYYNSVASISAAPSIWVTWFIKVWPQIFWNSACLLNCKHVSRLKLRYMQSFEKKAFKILLNSQFSFHVFYLKSSGEKKTNHYCSQRQFVSILSSW